MADAFPSDQACHLIAQCSLGKADSSASLSQLEQDCLSQDIERWHQTAKENSSQVIGKIQFAEEKEKCLNQSTTGDGRDLASFSDALQAVMSSLKRVADIKVQLQDEALNWKQRYELERLKNLQLQRSIEASYPAEGKHGQPAQWNGQFSDGNGIPAGRQILHSTSVSPRPLTSEYGSLKLKDGIGKASFRLGWGFDREKHRQHKHEIVSYECGNITAATRTSKQITLIWDTHPQSVCILCKPDSASVQVLCKEMVRWLFLEKGMIVYVEPRVRNELVNAEMEFSFVKTWENDDEVFLLHNKVDLLITLGGDGTVLWAASLFKGPVPPMVSFSMGSLGFMTPFHSQTYRESLEAVMEGPVYITLRHRLHCEVLRSQSNVKAGENTDSQPTEAYVVLNEVSIDRGMSSFLTNLECFCDNVFVTYVQGDGLILSTPSGSTAYSLAAGGSMVHPQVPAILFTPICPHSLSFRPLILPEYVTLRVQLPLHSRGNAWVSFDGKNRLQLNPGDALVCHMDACPVPAVCIEESTYHFLHSVQEGLHWNLRKHQSTE